jgi:hypothetical protein
VRSAATRSGACEHGCVEPDRIHERADIVGEVAQPVAIRWLCGVAMPALVERERTDPPRQHGHQLIEVPPRVQPGVEQHNRNAITIALLDVGQLESIPKHGQTHHAPILSAARQGDRAGVTSGLPSERASRLVLVA